MFKGRAEAEKAQKAKAEQKEQSSEHREKKPEGRLKGETIEEQ